MTVDNVAAVPFDGELSTGRPNRHQAVAGSSPGGRTGRSPVSGGRGGDGLERADPGRGRSRDLAGGALPRRRGRAGPGGAGTFSRPVAAPVRCRAAQRDVRGTGRECTGPGAGARGGHRARTRRRPPRPSRGGRVERGTWWGTAAAGRPLCPVAADASAARAHRAARPRRPSGHRTPVGRPEPAPGGPDRPGSGPRARGCPAAADRAGAARRRPRVRTGPAVRRDPAGGGPGPAGARGRPGPDDGQPDVPAVRRAVRDGGAGHAGDAAPHPAAACAAARRPRGRGRASAGSGGTEPWCGGPRRPLRRDGPLRVDSGRRRGRGGLVGFRRRGAVPVAGRPGRGMGGGRHVAAHRDDDVTAGVARRRARAAARCGRGLPVGGVPAPAARGGRRRRVRGGGRWSPPHLVVGRVRPAAAGVGS